MSRPLATTITFLISALAHELVMGCITRKFRGYGFIAMMLQMPIVMLQRSKWVRGRTLLNNVLFWCSMILGLSMVSIFISPRDRLMLTMGRCALYMCLYNSQSLRHMAYVCRIERLGLLVGGTWREQIRLAKYPLFVIPKSLDKTKQNRIK